MATWTRYPVTQRRRSCFATLCEGLGGLRLSASMFSGSGAVATAVALVAAAGCEATTGDAGDAAAGQRVSADASAAGETASSAPDADGLGDDAVQGVTSGDAAEADVPVAPVELPPCLAPSFPQLDRYPPGTVLLFDAAEGTEVALTWNDGEVPTWSPGPELMLPTTPGPVHVHARSVGCEAVATAVTDARIEVADGFASSADVAIDADDPTISGWASEVTHVSYGTGVDETWRTPEEALGPAGDDALATLVLGNGGQVTLGFDPSIRDEPGPDFAVFENAFLQFYELAFVEVSSDGVHFERFASRYLGTVPVSPFGAHDSTWIGGLAGKHPLGFGTAFDLEWLHSAPAVQLGLVDLDAIRHVRIIDIIGDGETLDSFGAPIYDPTPTAGSGGFDLDGIARLSSDP